MKIIKMKNKNYFILLVLLPLIFFSCSSKVQELENEEPKKPEIIKDEYVINNEFEELIDFTGKVGGWEIFGGGNRKDATALYREGIGYKGSNTIRLRANQGSDIAVSQYLAKKLEYRKLYRLSGKIKTESVAGEGGANLSIIGTYQRSDYVKGNSDWTHVYIDFFAPKDGKVAIGNRLGFWNAEATGIAYFDNIRVTEPDDVYIVKGKNVEIYLGKKVVYGTDQEMENWVKRLDNFYTSYVDLFKGKAPFEAQKMVIQSNPGNIYWAFAGEFIQWNENYVNGALKLVVEKGDICFGIVHEMAHNFAPGNWEDYNGSWIWDEEVFANFRMAYALENLNETTIMNEKKFVGADVINFYKLEYEKTIGQGLPANGDATLYTMLRITKKYGWEPLKLAFDDLYNLDKGLNIGTTNWRKFEYFLDAISKYTDEDVRSTYSSKDLQALESFLK